MQYNKRLTIFALAERVYNDSVEHALTAQSGVSLGGDLQKKKKKKKKKTCKAKRRYNESRA
jgi:hypothetical protein